MSTRQWREYLKDARVEGPCEPRPYAYCRRCGRTDQTMVVAIPIAGGTGYTYLCRDYLVRLGVIY